MFRYYFLVIYTVYMLLKHIKLLYELQTLDPRLSYAKQMEAVYDKPKSFMRGCIGLTGSTVSIHQFGKTPKGPVLYVHPKLKLADLAVLLGHLDKTPSFFAEPRAFRYPLVHQWLNKMGAIKKNGGEHTAVEQIEEIVRKGQSFILSEVDGIDYESLSSRLGVPIVPIETSGIEDMQKGSFFKRLKPADLDLTIHRAYLPENKRLRA
ncbi:1-acyl-sn-glycerol-3-phosphate acyltransferase [Bacillus sonorensis]|uniref:1-acyl-sn-glycerol-3-phosphate acyltransferase n=1 Tax=Bacillus sonorensis TaxID=119858 RepID=UPI00227FF71D|nr:1-acyl-sn-glycerol-3-phosphate acyltransferase [Bacillus sonorensis]MCY7856870.1 1-acyl-sn-glycerol-3-phosphate acyltransferase [Bacillus sonorensis]MCY8035976.1 1-acyl-sn-glycerol-3-phosphate acyltransferase [Bacillus sonorensis]MCY8089533.1 1-acyl-sn-glycerol-3-phosphate acyltransferase [Bacillus sonorensis]MCY8564945.1 1-acyl-sn-glycerol-3-phosphate acyltransferase [Bacillus sonorensis]MEC1355806.1 1-acyl-sn-glycerol-3-phosphate acyltransferase [Bacillus sonorensis]